MSRGRATHFIPPRTLGFPLRTACGKRINPNTMAVTHEPRKVSCKNCRWSAPVVVADPRRNYGHSWAEGYHYRKV